MLLYVTGIITPQEYYSTGKSLYHAIWLSCHRNVMAVGSATATLQFHHTKELSSNSIILPKEYHSTRIEWQSTIRPFHDIVASCRGHEHHATVSSQKNHVTVMHIISQKNNVTAEHANQISTTLTSYHSRVKSHSDHIKLPHKYNATATLHL